MGGGVLQSLVGLERGHYLRTSHHLITSIYLCDSIQVLDEATASVDTATDGVIQQTLADNFGECTVISIAHRIPSVIDSDKVMVLEQGEVREFDAPLRLLERPSSMFAKLVAEYSRRSGSMADLASMARNQSGQALAGMG